MFIDIRSNFIKNNEVFGADLMETLRRHYYVFLAVFMFILCVLCIAIAFWAIRSSESIHVTQTYNQIYEIKKANLKDTVQNMIRNIDRIRLKNRRRAEDQIGHLRLALENIYGQAPGRFAELVPALLQRPEYQKSLNTSFSQNLEPSGDASVLSFGPNHLQLSVNEEWVDMQTKRDIADLIHSQEFEYEGYIWVNEIVNWEGGDNYAIRRIHPNLIDTEGSYLSTNMEDVKGNTPYLTELEGIKESGELFFTYFFKRKDSSEIAEKLTYAALYEDYSWIVAMGVHLEDVQLYIDNARSAVAQLSTRIFVVVIAVMLVFFLSALFVLVRLETWYMHKTNVAIRKESNHDSLTGALNRRMGELYVFESFRRFQRGIDNPALVLIDLDDFKRVNDIHGHDVGDRLLRAVVDQIHTTMRVTDHLFRWGGEEFLLILNGVDHDGAASLAEKLNRSIAAVSIQTGVADSAADNIQVSASIGITWFEKTDSSPAAALRRADMAMYRAKTEGKNRARFADTDY